MWIVKADEDAGSALSTAILHLDTIVCATHLIGVMNICILYWVITHAIYFDLLPLQHKKHETKKFQDTIWSHENYSQVSQEQARVRFRSIGIHISLPWDILPIMWWIGSETHQVWAGDTSPEPYLSPIWDIMPFHGTQEIMRDYSGIFPSMETYVISFPFISSQ